MANHFIEVLRSYMRACKFTVHDFVIMPDHVHILITVPAGSSVEKAVQLIKGHFSFRAKRSLGSKVRFGSADSRMSSSTTNGR
jgi:putative transposase